MNFGTRQKAETLLERGFPEKMNNENSFLFQLLKEVIFGVEFFSQEKALHLILMKQFPQQ